MSFPRLFQISISFLSVFGLAIGGSFLAGVDVCSAAGYSVEARAPFTVSESRPEHSEIKISVAADNFDRAKNGSPLQTLELPISPTKSLSLELERFEVVAPDARFLIGSVAGDSPIGRPDVVLFRGKLADQPNSHAFISFSSSGLVNGWVEGDNQPGYVVATLIDDLKSGGGLVTVRPTPAFGGELEVPFCGAEDAPDWLSEFDPTDRMAPPLAAGPYLQHVAIDADQRFVQIFDNTYQATDYIVQLIGAISSIYERDNNIRMVLSYARLWPSGGEPFSVGDLGGFREHWIDNEDTTGLNLVHMFSGVRSAPYGGVAYYSTTCNGFGYGIDAYMNGSFLHPVTYPDNGNWDVNLVAHEMGHNHGAPHTHDNFYSPHIDDCGNGTYTRGTIMSYCHTSQGYQRNIDLRFHRRTQLTISDRVWTAGCHPRDCNGNGIADADDISLGTSLDANSDGIPDECQDCNNNGQLDPVEIAGGLPDSDGNGIPDECEEDCNSNGFPDQYETWNFIADDDDGNNVPDECDPDCNSNGILDYSEIQSDMTLDLDRDRILDECQDCNSNGIADWIDLGRQYNMFVCDQGTSELREFHAVSGVSVRNIPGLIFPVDAAPNPPGSHVVVADQAGIIWAVDVSSGTTSTLVSSGSGGLVQPTSVVFGPDGNLYVADYGTNMIKRYHPVTGAYLGDFITSATSLTNPYGLTFGPNGNVFVTSATNEVYEFQYPAGAVVSAFVTTGAGGLADPRGLVFKNDGNLLVVSRNNNKILEYDGTTGSFVKEFSDEYGWIDPWGIKVGPNGNIFLAADNGGQGRIFEFVNEGRYYRSFVRGSGYLNIPTGLCFLPGSPSDLNANFLPDACETQDTDEDGLLDYMDNCPFVSNLGQADADNDGIGDVCDNCPSSANSDQRDFDGDGIGDECDNCPSAFNPAQTDGDSDGRGDECDNCPSIANASQDDIDGDFIGDVCDDCPNDLANDRDGDDVCGDIDNCPLVYNPDQTDLDNNGYGDICEPEIYDTVASFCMELSVSSQGNFGGHAHYTATMDYFNQGDCSDLYLYDGSPVLSYIDGADTVVYSNLYGSNHFGLAPGGAFPVPSIDSGAFEVYRTATLSTPDTAVGIEKVWYAPKALDSCNFIIQCTRFFSADGQTHSGLALGEFIDWDVPSSSGSDNNASWDAGSKAIWQTGVGSGCENNTTRYGAMSLVGTHTSGDCVNTSATPYGAVSDFNSTYIFPTNGLVGSEAYQLMQMPNYNVPTGASERFSLMTYFNSATLGPGDTLYVYTALLTSTDAPGSVIFSDIDKAWAWCVRHVVPACEGTTCCVGIRGDVDNGGSIDVGDLTYMVDYLFNGGPPPACAEEADANGSGGLDVSDVSSLVDYLFRSGPAPVDCP